MVVAPACFPSPPNRWEPLGKGFLVTSTTVQTVFLYAKLAIHTPQPLVEAAAAMRELSERCLHMDHSLSHHGTRPRSSDRREAAGPMGLAVDRVIQARMELVSPGILHSKGGGYLFSTPSYSIRYCMLLPSFGTRSPSEVTRTVRAPSPRPSAARSEDNQSTC